MATVEVAVGRRARARGLLGRSAVDGALWLPGVRSVHAIGMQFTLDVARCDGELVVVRVDRLEPGRVLLPVRGARHTVEAAAGAFDRWRLGPGAALGVFQPGS